MRRNAYLRAQVRNKLRKLGLPDNLFDADFWEKEKAAREQEERLLELLEQRWQAGVYKDLSVPVDQIIERWRAKLASPLYFSSKGHRPDWVDKCNDSVADWRCRQSGSRQKSWNKYKQKWRARRKEMGLPWK